MNHVQSAPESLAGSSDCPGDRSSQLVFCRRPLYSSNMHRCSAPFAHTRFEHLSEGGFPTVAICILGAGPLEAWEDFKKTHGLAISTQRTYARAIGLFIDFMAINGDKYLAVEDRRRFLQKFADSLIRGTIEDADDPTGLFWMPRTYDSSRRILAAVTAFSDWLTTSYGVKPLNPLRKATIAEQLSFWHVWNRVKDKGLMKHLKGVGQRDSVRHSGGYIRTVRVRGASPTISGDLIKAFPEDRFMDLLEFGFKRPARRGWTTLRDRMIAILLHEGGLRLCEVLQIWVNDVYQHPQSPAMSCVRVYHPREGLREHRNTDTGKAQLITSAEYLRVIYGRVPLTDLPGHKAVGWKNPMLNDVNCKFMNVFWRSEDAARAFMSLYLRYVQTRPMVRGHPYLFVADGGEPMNVRAYEKVHAAAVRRLGLIPTKVAGTTPHGHRHSYGRSLARSGADRKVIQVAMHHKSVFSQETYSEADSNEVSQAILALSSNQASILSGLALDTPGRLLSTK